MTMTDMDKGPVGETLEEFLDELGIRNEVYDVATKRVVAWQLEEARKASGMTKIQMATNMGSSRSQLDRVLDPDNVAVSLQMLSRAASALGKRLQVEIVDAS
jgi:DNA-binding phage protein